jgi:hypothetical protein
MQAVGVIRVTWTPCAYIRYVLPIELCITMALSQAASRLFGTLYKTCECPLYFNLDLVPIAVGLTVINASIYDVPGGYRAVMFDRFQGVKGEVCSALMFPDASDYVLLGVEGRHAFPCTMVATCYSLRCSYQAQSEYPM